LPSLLLHRIPPPPSPTLLPYTTLFRSLDGCPFDCGACPSHQQKVYLPVIPITSSCNLDCPICYTINKNDSAHNMSIEAMEKILRSEEHTSELQSRFDLVCRLLLEKKKK